MQKSVDWKIEIHKAEKIANVLQAPLEGQLQRNFCPLYVLFSGSITLKNCEVQNLEAQRCAAALQTVIKTCSFETNWKIRAAIMATRK